MSQNGTILIVEDNEMSLEMAKNLLQRAGFNTLEAPNADRGIHLAREYHPNLILMDMHLPLKSGYEASLELKADFNTRHIPIVAFTALAMAEEQQRAIAHGCTGVISKPINIKQFAQTVECFLSTHQPLLDEPELIKHPAIALPESDDCVHCAQSQNLRQELEEFLFHVSHDLQGPLRKIQQFVKFMENPPESDLAENEKQIYLQGISRSAKGMENLLQRLMTLSRIHFEGRLFTKISLNELVTDAVSQYRHQIQASKATVEVEELSVVLGDPMQLQMAFEEILGNSLKFQPKDQPPVIRIQGRPLDNGFYEITVQDNGIGLLEGNADNIFRPLKRLNSVSQFPGEGMGLAIAKRIVERHGGKISALAGPEVGMSIQIQLPPASIDTCSGSISVEPVQ